MPSDQPLVRPPGFPCKFRVSRRRAQALDAVRAAIALLVAVARVAALEARDLVCLGLQAIAGDGSVRARYRSGLMMVVELGQIRDVG